MGTTKMDTTKKGTTKKSATKPNKRFWVGGIDRMTKPSLRKSKSGFRLFYQIDLTRIAELKKKVIATMMKPSLRNSKPGFRLFYRIILTRTVELKMRKMAAVARKHPRVISTNKKHHKHATVVTDSADNRVGEELEPTDDKDNVTNDGATEGATAGDTIADETTEVATSAAQTSSTSHARDVSRIPQPPVGRTAAQENRTRIMRHRERQRYIRYVEDCRRRGEEPRM